jgi:methylase of polypeptide subunit release factors
MSIAFARATEVAPRTKALSTLIASLRGADYRFVTPTPSTHQRVLDRTAHAEARDLRDVFGWSRVFSEGLLPAPLFDRLRREGLLVRAASGWRSTVRVSSLDDDLFVHSAFPTTAADSVFFGPDTYRFARAIQNHLRSFSGKLRRAVDIGCGAGVGGVIVARAASCDEVLMTDINDKALHFSGINVTAAGLDNVVTVKSSILDGVDGEFDLIVSNPPYLNDPLGRAYRNGGGALGSALSIDIAGCAMRRLAPGGSLLLYTGAPIVNGNDPFPEAIRGIFEGSGLTWTYREVDPDVFGEELDTEAYREADRIAAVVLTARKPGELRC